MNDSLFSFTTEKIDENAVMTANIIYLSERKSRQKNRLNRRLNQAYWLSDRLQSLADFIQKKTA